MPLLYTTVKPFVAPLMRAVWGIRTSGLENVPRSGAFLIASNHIALVDSFIIPIVTPRMVRFIAKDTYWKKRGPIGWIQRTFFEAVGTVPVDRQTLSSGRGALEVALGVLRHGDGFGIYPEGTRSPDGRLHRGKQGVAWLAEQAGCPVIPVGLIGTDTLFSSAKHPTRQGITQFRRGGIEVRFGTPVDLSSVDPSLPAGARRRAMTELVMERIAELSGQERAES